MRSEAEVVRLERAAAQESFHRKQAELLQRRLQRELDAARLRCLDCPVCRDLPSPVVCDRELGLTPKHTPSPPPIADTPTLPLSSPRRKRVEATGATAALLLDKDRSLLRLRNHIEQLEAHALALQQDKERLQADLDSKETNLLRCEEKLRQMTQQQASQASQSAKASVRSHSPKGILRSSSPSLSVQGKGILKRSSSSGCLLNAKAPKTPPASAPASPRRGRPVNSYCQSCQSLRRRLEMMSASQRRDKKEEKSPRLLPSGGTFPRANRFPNSRPPAPPDPRPAPQRQSLLRGRSPSPGLAAPAPPRPVSPGLRDELRRVRADLALEREQRQSLERLLDMQQHRDTSCALCKRYKTDLDSARSKLQREVAKAGERTEELQRRAERAERDLRTARDAAERAQTDARTARAAAEAAQSRPDSGRGGRAELQRAVTEMGQMAETQRRRLGQLEVELATAKKAKERAVAETEAHLAEIRRLGAELEALERARMASRAEAAEAGDESGVPQTPEPPTTPPELTEVRAEAGRLRRELRASEGERERLAVEARSERDEAERHRGRLQERSQERQALLTELAKLREMLLGLEGEKGQLRSELSAAKARGLRLDSELARLESDLAAANAKARALTAKLRDAELELSQARKAQGTGQDAQLLASTQQRRTFQQHTTTTHSSSNNSH